MPGVITMPALSDTMGAGRLVKWTKKTGDKIKKGDLIAEVETDKAVMDVEAFQDGYLSGPLADEGTEAPVGQIIGYIADSLNDVRTVESATPVAPRPDEDGSIAEKPAADKPAVSTVLAASMATMRPTPARRPVASAQVSPPGSHPAAVGPQRHGKSLLAVAIAAGPPYRLERASVQREAVARTMIASAATPTFRVTAELPLNLVAAQATE